MAIMDFKVFHGEPKAELQRGCLGITDEGALYVGDSNNIAKPPLTFVYHCTGVEDDLAIQNIINDFFDNGTAMTMKLIITGIMGLQENPANDSYITIISNNPRGSVCYLDFNDCNIPETNNTFFEIETSNLIIDGLIFTSSAEKALFIRDLSKNISINRCIINAINPAFPRFCGIDMRGEKHSITNCTINILSGHNFVYGMQCDNATNCLIENCDIFISGLRQAESYEHTYAYGIHANTSYSLINNCNINIIGDITSGLTALNNATGIYLNSSGTYVLNCDISVSNLRSRGTMAPLLPVARGIENNDYNFIQNCIINVFDLPIDLAGSRGITCSLGPAISILDCKINCEHHGIYIPSSFLGIALISGCRITGGAVGIYTDNNNVNAEIKLVDCAIKGISTQDVQQTTAASTVKWYIMGNSFSRATIIVDGTTAINNKAASASIYFPQYANKFSRTIE